MNKEEIRREVTRLLTARKKEKQKKVTTLLVDFLHENSYEPSQEYFDWLQKQAKKGTGLCSIFDFYAEKIMKVVS
jgi:hypothetical protein